MTGKEARGDGGADRMLDRERVRKSVERLVAELTGADGITEESDLVALGLDSMKRLELLAHLEERFSIALTEDMASRFGTIAGIVRVVADASSRSPVGNRGSLEGGGSARG